MYPSCNEWIKSFIVYYILLISIDQIPECIGWRWNFLKFLMNKADPSIPYPISIKGRYHLANDNKKSIYQVVYQTNTGSIFYELKEESEIPPRILGEFWANFQGSHMNQETQTQFCLPLQKRPGSISDLNYFNIPLKIEDSNKRGFILEDSIPFKIYNINNEKDEVQVQYSNFPNIFLLSLKDFTIKYPNLIIDFLEKQKKLNPSN